MKPLIASGLMIATLAIGGGLLARQGKSPAPEPDTISGPTETAVFSGGCFWGLQAAFDELPGVVSTRTGYAGGTTSSPTYGQVVAGKTGHAEAVEVVFDPGRVSYEELVRHFFKHHRSTSDEPEMTYRTKPYRSEIFVQNAEQRKIAERVRAGFAARAEGDKLMATLIGGGTRFWEAESYHQKYLAQCSR